MKRRPWTFGPRKYLAPHVHQKGMQIAHLRRAILKAWALELKKIEKPKTKTQATLEFLQLLNSGLLIPEGTAFRLRHVSRATLYNWEKRNREGGFKALLPHYRWKPGSGAAVVPISLTSTLREIKIPGAPKRRDKYEIQSSIARQWKGPRLQCPIQVAIYYSMPIRKGTKMSRRMKMLNRKISHTGNPHLDTLNAFIVNCLAGIVFYDYNQIVLFHSEKNFSWWPQTRVVIRALSE